MRFFALIFPAFIFSQLHHSTISSYGSSGTNHIISIGQNSAINVNSSSNVIQGYINNVNFRYKISDIEDSFHLITLVYPNPFVSSFKAIFSEKKENINLKISSLNGQLKYNKNFKKSNEIQIDIPHLSSQTYLITISADGKFYKAKLIKQQK